MSLTGTDAFSLSRNNSDVRHLMSFAGYSVLGIGPHELFRGIDVFTTWASEASFDVVATNVAFGRFVVRLWLIISIKLRFRL